MPSQEELACQKAPIVGDAPQPLGDFGKEPANSFTSDQHPDLRANYVMANPPFNISEWWDAKLEGDPRWRYGTLPRGNANLNCMRFLQSLDESPSSDAGLDRSR